jgi:hypothetical protein
MKKLSKESKNYIVKLISDRENIKYILAFCKGLGLDTTHYSNPVYITENNITIRYRGVNTYYSI